MRVLIVVNPFATSVTARNRVVVTKALRDGNDVSLVETNRRGHASRLAADAAARGVDVVVAFGGDGTLNEVANGLAGTETALAPLPGGSTNVFARTIGLPNDPVPAVHILAGAIRRQSMKRVGLGMLNGRYFLFHTGIGFDAAVVERVEQRGQLKRWAGHPLFIYAGITTWVRYRRDPPRFRAVFPGGEVLDDRVFAVVLNTNPYTYLGNTPLDLSPAATLERGLVLVTFASLKAPLLLRSVASALRGRGLPSLSGVDERSDLDRVLLTAARPVPYQVDGDFLGELNRFDFRQEPDAIDLVIP
jgi:diacylglycerol kinase family enzyme